MQFKTYPLPGGGELDVYLRTPAPAMPNALRRPLVLVVPGGGYNHVSPREGDPVALQFAAAGYHTAVLTYSVGEGAQNYRPLRQLNEALALLRQNAGEWHILPDKIAVCGFSAGGHLALSGAVLAQYQRSADINLGTGMVVIGLASLIIGETLFGRGGMWVKAVAAVAGSVIYRFIIALALRANVPSECLKLISAVIVALAIAAPALKAKADFRRRRANAQKGGARHA